MASCEIKKREKDCVSQRPNQKVLFDSLTVHFSLSIFLEQLLNHLFFPLLLPWMVYQHGWNCLIAQGFLPHRWSARALVMSAWNWASPMIVYYLIYRELTGTKRVNMSVMIPMILYCMHRALVALKYATMSDSELRRLMRGSNIPDSAVNYKYPSQNTRDKSVLYQEQSMITSGYIFITSAVVNFEIVVAAARSGIPIRNVYFEIPNPNLGNKEKLQFLRWQVFLSKALHICLCDTEGQNHMDKILLQREDGSYCVNIHSVCVAIVHATCQCSSPVGRKAIILLAVFNATIPAYMTEWPYGRPRLFCYLSILILNLVFFWIMLTILFAGIKEMERKSHIASILDTMLRLHDHNMKANIRVGAATDEGVVTREIKMIQDLLAENAEMIRLSSVTRSANEYGAISNALFSNSQCSGVTESLLDTDGEFEGNVVTASAVSYPQDPKEGSLSDSSLEGSDLSDFHIPQLELLEYSNNFVSWMQCRKILHNFGHRFSIRLSIYVAIILLLLITLSLSLVVTVVGNDEENPLKESGVVQTVLWIIVCSFSLSIIIAYAHLTNLTNISHRETVSSHMLNMKQALCSAVSESERQKLTAGIDSAFTVTQSLSIMNEALPIRIFGIQANIRTAALILYALFVFLFVVFQYSSGGQIHIPV